MTKPVYKIAMYGGALRMWGNLNPTALFEDVPSPAGTELAMMTMARALAQRGHRVTVFANCEGGTYDGVDYLNADLAIPLLTSNDYDVVVSWQDASIFLYKLRAKLRVVMSESTRLGLGNAAPSVDRYFGISRFSAKTLLDLDPYADPSRMWVTRNGIYTERFAARDWEAKQVLQQPHSMVWMSSPDRGLHHLVDIFPKVREAVPDATLTVLYNFDRTIESYRKTQPGSAYVRWLEKAVELKQMEGVTVLNHVSQPVLARILDKTQVVAYPCDPLAPTETYCTSITEALAAGCYTIVSDADCLPENYSHYAVVLPRPINTEEWVKEIVEAMTNDTRRQAQVDMGYELAKVCTAQEVAWEWECFFESYLAGAEIGPDFSLAARLERTAGVAV